MSRWARLFSRRERMMEEDAYQAAMGRALERKSFLKTSGRYLSREEVDDRQGPG